MSIHGSEPHSLWLEFEDPAGACARSQPYAFVRPLEASIVGGARQSLIRSLYHRQWRLAADPGLRIARIRGVGVFSVHLEQFGERDVTLPCSRILVVGRQLEVDGRVIAQLEVRRRVWRRTADAGPLHGVRRQPDGGGATLDFAHLPQRRTSRSGASA
ncbi:MAG: hypothetical protein ING59_13305 [Burkholderiales bacterium]|jgi:hypothetical protein|nr:hypothetical protein [Burkholderiales bacterium]